jgi:hypothetical protein
VGCGFRQCRTSEYCMYVKELDGAQLRYCLYVDDLLCTYPAAHVNPAGEAMHLETIKAMQEKYDLDDDGLVDCTAFIGMNFTWAPWLNVDTATNVPSTCRTSSTLCSSPTTTK